jgi:hypothetical protein
LKALGEGALGFADLKKKTGIESSGHLQHHLSKLGPLVKTNEYGNYCLSDQGRDALLPVQTVENVAVSGRENGSHRLNAKRPGSRNILKVLAIGFAFMLLASVAYNAYELNQTEFMQNQVSQRDLAINQLQEISRIQVVKSTPDIGMSYVFRTIFVGNDTTNLKPYTLSVSITVQIRNPTPYNVTLQLQGELDTVLSGQESGNRAWNETRYFSVPMYSDGSYQFFLYKGGEYADPNAVRVVVNSCEVYVVSGHILSE